MPINSRRKGKAGEREVARLLEEWWGKVEAGVKFRSTPLSGGFSSPDVRGAFEISGDLMTTALTFPYTIEVKHRESWSLKNLETGRKSPVWGWWNQCQVAAAEEEKIPMLWFRKNRMPWRIIVPEYNAPLDVECSIAWKEDFSFDVGAHPVCFMASDFLK
jgi:hypothetical protein